ncbi:MAG: exopolysaccharide biosynthesis polyprenyl glycosylphosphotransferase [Verrucomicrobiota bacterium JB022]|nr:exopolysaccharide biosynthesis polyprenyl glycosylphosphotransferase [Verrucomicrobiota bacterium JB022]
MLSTSSQPAKALEKPFTPLVVSAPETHRQPLARFTTASFVSGSLAVFDTVLSFGVLQAISWGVNHYWKVAVSPGVIGATALGVWITSILAGGYRRSSLLRGDGWMMDYWTAVILFAVVSGALFGFSIQYDWVTIKSALLVLLSVSGTILIGMAARKMLARFLRDTLRQRYIMVVGSPEHTREFCREMQAENWPHRVVHVDMQSVTADGVASRALWGQAREAQVESVVLLDPVESASNTFKEMLLRWDRHSIPVFDLHRFYANFWQKVPPYALHAGWGQEEGFLLHRQPVYRMIKRAVDLAGGSVMLVALSPLLALLALAVRLESKGPAIFRQTRVGQGGTPFTIYKFRTMCESADKGDRYTRTNDKRITRVGAILRKTRLDELPQLFNVLQGQMSLIGPRAEWVRCTEEYEKTIPYYHWRHIVKPGISGWAQVNYGYGENEEDTKEKLKLDLYYVKHYSPWLDIRIILKTLSVVVTGKGQ